MQSDNYMDSLRAEILELVEKYLTPVALRYAYSDSPLETNIKWRPLVLVLGNYSSGKSTLINEFLEAEIQATGQAPTDDSFTIITYGEPAEDTDLIKVTEERDGKFLLNDPEFPFETFKKHGQRFSSHFRIKKVNSPFLKNIAIIDTPGMLDSITERDRGYNYQEVIGDFAHIADLVLVLFDTHKAGTVREAYTSLRDTLPARTFEDRILFVLNRIDECESLSDLLRVYGTLCWNLSQMTGRKDIPMIFLTYSHKVLKNHHYQPEDTKSYLRFLENQREELKELILQAPRHRLDNLATFVEMHGERISHFLEALINYRVELRKVVLKFVGYGILISMLAFGLGVAGMMASSFFQGLDQRLMIGSAALFALAIFSIWLTIIRKSYVSRFFNKKLKDIDNLTSLGNQTRRDNWAMIKSLVSNYLNKTKGRFSLNQVRNEFNDVKMVYQKGGREIRQALNELSTISFEDTDATEIQNVPD
jgi:GTPase SAR1 family protein